MYKFTNKAVIKSFKTTKMMHSLTKRAIVRNPLPNVESCFPVGISYKIDGSKTQKLRSQKNETTFNLTFYNLFISILSL